MKSKVFKILLVCIAFVLIAMPCHAQSRRQQPIPDKTTQTQAKTVETKKNPDTPKSDENDEVIRVSSALVSIPVSVLDSKGRPVEGLDVADFFLAIDGQPKEIEEFTTSDSPVKLTLLFDNSSSLTIARNFEKKASTRFLRTVLRPDIDSAALYSIATEWRLEAVQAALRRRDADGGARHVAHRSPLVSPTELQVQQPTRAMLKL